MGKNVKARERWYFPHLPPPLLFFLASKKARFLKNVFPGLKPGMSSFSPEQIFMAE